MSLERKTLFRRFGAAWVDFSLEVGGGLLGSYFGAMVAALMTVMKDGHSQHMQRSIWNGVGFGFTFWAFSVSFLNRVLVQGLSRSSIGKKVFKLELISTGPALTWGHVLTRWLASFASTVFAGSGYLYAFLDKEKRTFHDLIAHTDVVPVYESQSMTVEYREENYSFTQIHQMMVLSSQQAERPTATIIRLPVTEKTASVRVMGPVATVTSIADVVAMKDAKDGKKAA